MSSNQPGVPPCYILVRNHWTNMVKWFLNISNKMNLSNQQRTFSIFQWHCHWFLLSFDSFLYSDLVLRSILIFSAQYLVLIMNQNSIEILNFFNDRCTLNSNRRCISESTLKYRARCCLNPLLLLLESYKSAYCLNGARCNQNRF